MNVHSRDLRYFVTVAEELHFTRAAERLFVSQPALSKQIRLLEKTLGTALFERDRRSVRLTDAGTALLPHARRVLAACDAGQAAVELVKAHEATRLRIGMSTSPGRGGMLPAVRSRFTDAFPSARLELRQVGWQDSTAGLGDGSTDLAYVWLPLPDEHRFRWIVMVSEPRYVALPQQHPLASHDTVAFADLLDEPFLALPESAGVLREYWLALDARTGHTPRIGAVISNLDETYEALVDGRGICLLAAGNAVLLTRGGVVVRPVTGISPCHLALAWRSDDTRPQIHAYAHAAATVATALYDGLTTNPHQSEKPRRHPIHRRNDDEPDRVATPTPVQRTSDIRAVGFEH